MNALYTKGKQNILEGNIDIINDDMRLYLLSSTYVSDILTDEYVSDIPSNSIVASALLTGKDTLDGIFTADDITFSSLTGDTVVAMVIAKDTGSVVDSPLLYFADTGVGFPYIPDGNDLPIQWAAEGIFEL